jgi:hypothetical protein
MFEKQSVIINDLFIIQRIRKQIAEPSPCAVLSIGPKKFETEEIPNTDSPVWEKPFRFLVNNPQIQKLDIQVSMQYSGLKSTGSYHATRYSGQYIEMY